MAICTRKGCQQEFDPADNAGDACTFHPGAPVFHEGLKSWACCQAVNKPVLDFDEFMKIPGCATGTHSTEAPAVPAPKPAPQADLKMTSSSPGGAETYSSRPTPAPATPTPRETAVPAPPAAAPKFVEEEDDPTAAVPEGTKCRHNGCKLVYASDELHRADGGAEAECTYHPKPPMFHEGSKVRGRSPRSRPSRRVASPEAVLTPPPPPRLIRRPKGYLCCKPRVLEFDEFLKIEGCKKGRHVFVPKAREGAGEEVFTQCRIDHYQTPSEVHASVFAKKANTETSTVQIEEDEVHIDLYLPDNKRFRKTLQLWGPVDVEASSFKFFGTKLELKLRKKDNRSWTLLEKTDKDLGNITYTFGVGGRTGTIGAKELVLDDVNKARE
ncbi:chord-domain-containing protein [Epithele typhae]|uniref:chord-domain-containing protein n=1 Tax=Epithele typhae TaxID=378194 RepID=UPI002007AADB|nr:chord-domain-containing protein [Epithele typhae]KAH9945969.1 chord-domain-containing protein [Epithele typhae]